MCLCLFMYVMIKKKVCVVFPPLYADLFFCFSVTPPCSSHCQRKHRQFLSWQIVYGSAGAGPGALSSALWIHLSVCLLWMRCNTGSKAQQLTQMWEWKRALLGVFWYSSEFRWQRQKTEQEAVKSEDLFVYFWISLAWHCNYVVHSDILHSWFLGSRQINSFITP